MIEDTGCGIADDDLPHIFERFYKGSNSKNDSYGIGLALARAIIAGQNGTIKAENVKGTDGNTCGARFIIRFYKGIDRKSTRLNSSHNNQSRMPSSA